MYFSQRTARSEIHFYIKGLTNRGYKKKGTFHYTGGYKVLLERIRGNRVDLITVKFSNNGWCSIWPGNHLSTTNIK